MSPVLAIGLIAVLAPCLCWVVSDQVKTGVVGMTAEQQAELDNP